MKINYIFRYHNSSELIYSGSKEDFETKIEEKMDVLADQTKIKINNITFDFDYNPSHESKYSLEVILGSPDIDFTHTEEDKDPQAMLHKSLDAVLRFVRKEKEKRSK